MKLEEIQTMWKNDSVIDRAELGDESLRIPQLHSKYFNIYSEERRILRAMERGMAALKRTKYEYYSGTLSEDELISNDWHPCELKILRTDIPMYLEGDKDIRDLQSRIDIQIEKVELTESIIKNLPARGYQIKAALDWEKFRMGA